jgi:hypothetical protein
MLEAAAREVDVAARAWRERLERDRAGAARTRRTGFTMIVLAVLASVASQVESTFGSSSIRSMSRAAVQAEAANDAWQHYNSRRIKEDLFDMHRARLAREVRELRFEGRGQGEYAAKLGARIRELEELDRRYERERAQNLARAQELEAAFQSAAQEGLLDAERGWFVKRGAGAFQVGIALLALALVLRSRALWAAGILAGVAGLAFGVYGLAFL